MFKVILIGAIVIIGITWYALKSDTKNPNGAGDETPKTNGGEDNQLFL
jgi:hypothetical protein